MPAQLTLMRSGPHRLGDVESLGDGVLVGDVGGDELGALTELGDHLLALQIDDHDTAAGVQQSLDSRQAQARRTSRDDRYRVLDLH